MTFLFLRVFNIIINIQNIISQSLAQYKTPHLYFLLRHAVLIVRVVIRCQLV